MADGPETRELFRCADEGQSVTVEITCGAPVAVGEEEFHPAAIVLESAFVRGRVDLYVSHGDLDDWGRCLDALAADEGAQWPDGDRSAWMEVLPEDPVEVTVHDAPSTQVAVRLPVDVGCGWLEDNRRRLRRVREALARRA